MDATDTLTRDDVAAIEMAAFAVVARDGIARAILPAIAVEAGVAVAAVRAVYATEADVARALLLRASTMDLTPIADRTTGGWDALSLRDIARALASTSVPVERNGHASASTQDDVQPGVGAVAEARHRPGILAVGAHPDHRVRRVAVDVQDRRAVEMHADGAQGAGHLDGDRAMHDKSVCQPGVFDKAVEAIRLGWVTFDPSLSPPVGSDPCGQQRRPGDPDRLERDPQLPPLEPYQRREALCGVRQLPAVGARRELFVGAQEHFNLLPQHSDY